MSKSLNSTTQDEVEAILDVVLNFALYFLFLYTLLKKNHILKYDTLDIFLKMNHTLCVHVHHEKGLERIWKRNTKG
jgi:hypothetical protein